jgi:hypothetical protein
MSADQIRALNDALRTTLNPQLGRVMMTSGVAALSESDRAAVFEKIRTFSNFTEANDPHGEHDFFSFDHAGTRYAVKIDYFDKNLEYGSEDPADTSKTIRVLTVMKMAEY